MSKQTHLSTIWRVCITPTPVLWYFLMFVADDNRHIGNVKVISSAGSSTLEASVHAGMCTCVSVCLRMHSVCWRIQTPGTAQWASSWTPCREKQSAPLSTVLFWVMFFKHVSCKHFYLGIKFLCDHSNRSW